MQLGDKFQLAYCPNVTFTLKRIDKTTKIHTFQMQDGSTFGRKNTEIDLKVNGWIKL